MSGTRTQVPANWKIWLAGGAAASQIVNPDGTIREKRIADAGKANHERAQPAQERDPIARAALSGARVAEEDPGKRQKRNRC
jgi:hypothetical protein